VGKEVWGFLSDTKAGPDITNLKRTEWFLKATDRGFLYGGWYRDHPG